MYLLARLQWQCWKSQFHHQVSELLLLCSCSGNCFLKEIICLQYLLTFPLYMESNVLEISMNFSDASRAFLHVLLSIVRSNGYASIISIDFKVVFFVKGEDAAFCRFL